MKQALEAALTWWQGRSPRERVMLSVMAGLIAALVAWYRIVVPVLDWRVSAAERRAEAQLRLTRIEAAAARLAPDPDQDAAAIQAAAQALATAQGLGATFTPAQGGGVDFAVPSAPTATLFGWIAGVRAQHRIEPVSLAVTENADATLAAQGTLRTVD